MSVRAPPPVWSSWSAVLWESDIPIDLQLPRECMRVSPHDAHPLTLFEHPSVATRGKISVDFCVTVPPSGDDVNCKCRIVEKVEAPLPLLQHLHVKSHKLKLCFAGTKSCSGLRVEGGERQCGEWECARVYQYQWNVWDHLMSPDLQAFELHTLLCH